jgi:hypothetical protein
MKRRTFHTNAALLLAVCIGTHALFAQPTKQWDKTFGGSGSDALTSLQQTADGGYILGGSSSSGASGDKSEPNKGPNNTRDYWLVKVDESGVKQWDKTFGSSGDDFLLSLQQTTDGGYILGGISWSGEGGDKSEPNRGTYSDYWLVKVDANGTKQWDKTFGGNSADALFSVQQTRDGGYILGGYSWSDVSGDKSEPRRGPAFTHDYWIVKVDAGGVKQWDKTFGGSGSDVLRTIHQTADGGYILGGYSDSDLSGDKNGPNKGDYDYWIVKVDGDGAKQWDKTFGGSGSDVLTSLQQTADGGYILGGSSGSRASGDKSDYYRGFEGFDDYWIVKVDASGKKQWDKTFGGNGNEGLYSLRQTTDGGYILGGYSWSDESGDKTEPSRGYNGSADYWLVKVDADGAKQWDKIFGGDGDDNLLSLGQTTDGSYILGGHSYSGVSGDKSEPNRGPGFAEGSYDTDDYWLVKLSPECFLQTFYRDADGDSYGNPAVTTQVCSNTPPAGYVSNSLDCNDYRVYYQDTDNDGWGSSVKIPCGQITRTGDCNDNNNRVHSPQTFYRDADGDSWGDPAMSIEVCSSMPPAGYVANKMDCNDQDKMIRYCPPTVCTTPSFAPAVQYATGVISPGNVTIADFNGDGKADIVVAAVGVEGFGNIGILLNNGNGTFAPAMIYSSGGELPGNVATADFNGDGKSDIAVANDNLSFYGNYGTVGVLLNNGNGTFAPAVTYGSGDLGPSTPTAADFNGDGKMDIAVTNSGSDEFGNIGILLNNGNGTFAPAMIYSSGGELPSNVATADFNGDGKPDLLVPSSNSMSIGILLNNGNGSFAPAQVYPSGGEVYTIADFNGDGTADVAVVNYGTNNISILLNKGNGSFAPAVMYGSGGEIPVRFTAADLNGDGKADIAVANFGTNNIGVLLNKGDGTFAPAQVYPSGGFLYTIADFNGDGKMDMVVANHVSGTSGLLLGNGDGTFAPAITYPSGGISPINVATADFNGDGKADMAAVNDGTNNIGIFLNTCGFVNPSLTSAQPLNSSSTHYSTAGQQMKVTTFTLSALPNPVAQSTRIQYSVPVNAQVSLKVYDVLGREVSTLFSGQRNAGTYTQEYNTTKLAQGVYYCRLLATAGGKSSIQTQKLVKAK